MDRAHSKKKILVLVEGAHTDVRLMEHLFHIYSLDADYEVIPYCTNIYALYNDMFRDGDPDSMDLLQVLKGRERNPKNRDLLDAQYTDVLLIFDLDPQDSGFSDERILSMMRYFSESSDMGKLYINYPMVESFYHMKSIPDPDFFQYAATIDELRARAYKARVHSENRNHDYSKYAVDREECNIVITQNLEKARLITGDKDRTLEEKSIPPRGESILEKQLALLKHERCVSVLCTSVFFIPEYNPRLIEAV